MTQISLLLSVYRAVLNPAKALSHLLTRPKVVKGTIIAGDSATINVLKYLPKGTFCSKFHYVYEFIKCFPIIIKQI